MRIGITISRTWDDYEAVADALQGACPGISHHKVTVVHGASQMDWFVAGVAYMLGMGTESVPANWSALGKRAGMVRNAEMVGRGADLWLAFIRGGSRGATHCAALAENAGIPVRRYARSA